MASVTASSRAIVQAVVQALPDALVATDTTGRIVLWNPAAQRLLGYPPEQAVGQTLALIIPSAARPAHVAGFHRAMDTGRTDTDGAPVIVHPTRADGATIEVEMRLALVTGDGGTTTGAVAVLRPTGPRRPLDAYTPSTADG